MPRRTGSGGLFGKIYGQIVEVETGTVIPRSTGKIALVMASLGIAVVTGLFSAVGGGWAVLAGLGFFKNNQNPVLVVAAGVVVFLLGLFLLLLGGYYFTFYIVRLRHKERVIIGRKYLQSLFDEAKANMQLPFDNIAAIRLGTKVEGDNKYQYIGIDLLDLQREDTILSPAGHQSFRKDFDADAVLFDEYVLPIETFYHKLVARWRKVAGVDAEAAAGTARRRRQSRDEDEDDRDVDYTGYRPPLKRSTRIVLGLMAGGMVLLTVLVGLAWVAKQRNMVPPRANVNGNPVPPNPNEPQTTLPPRITGDAALDKTLADINSNNPFVRQTALTSLAQMPPNEHRPLVAAKLAVLADSPDANTRQAVLPALGTWATPAEVPILIKTLNDPNPFVREEALKVVGPFKDERALAPVMRCFRNLSTRDPASKALREMGPMAEKDVLALLRDRDVLLRQAAIKVLKDVGTPRSVPALEQAAADAFLRPSAREALAAIAARNKP